MKELRSIGLQLDILVVRSDHEIPKGSRDKIALFTNVEPRAVIPLCDAESIYQIPSLLHQQRLDEIVVDLLRMDCPPADLSEWEAVVEAQRNPQHKIKLYMVGKYMDLLDAYKSLNEALIHAGIHTSTDVDVTFLDSMEVEEKGVEVPMTRTPFWYLAIRRPRFRRQNRRAGYARMNVFHILAFVTAYTRRLLNMLEAGLEGADTTENNPNTASYIGLITEWIDDEGNKETRDIDSDLGGTMRMGEQVCHLSDESLTKQIYVRARAHRHRYEVNNRYVQQLEEAGLRIAGKSVDNSLVEVIEISDHPWFVAGQFHPGYLDTGRSSFI